MPADTTMILFLNADQTTALYDLQVTLIDLRDCHGNSDVDQSTMRAMIDDANSRYRRVMCPTYEPEKN